VLALDACPAQTAPDHQLLFGAHETRLSAAEMRSVFAAMEALFRVSDDGSRLVDPDCGDIVPEVEIVDLNDDGTLEVFVAWGNTCLSGGTGRSLSLFVKDETGGYRHQLGFPALGYTPLVAGGAGLPDLAFGGPGFCRAVWAWDGDSYEHKCNLPDEPGGCEFQGNVCPPEQQRPQD
jgi:hypothetical protein